VPHQRRNAQARADRCLLRSWRDILIEGTLVCEVNDEECMEAKPPLKEPVSSARFYGPLWETSDA
jgi:hypothetical protein